MALDENIFGTFTPPQQAFEQAIAQGRLSRDTASDLYAGNYMYMGTVQGVDKFKHINTRRYLAE